MTVEDDEIRAEMRAAAEKARSAPAVSTGVPAGIFSGCCYLTKGTVRECFNDFTEDSCAQAGRGCGCFHQFVPGGRCSS